jgi:hypothetical protein
MDVRALFLGLSAYMAVPGQAPDGRVEGVQYGDGTVPGQAQVSKVPGSTPIPADNPASSYEKQEGAEGDVAGAPPTEEGVTEALEKVAVLLRQASSLGAEEKFPDKCGETVGLWAKAQEAFALEKYPEALEAAGECEKAVNSLIEFCQAATPMSAPPDGSGALDSSSGPATP